MENSFARQALAAFTALAALLALFAAVWKLQAVLLATFAAALLAMILNALACAFMRTGASYRWSVAAVVAALALLLAGAALLAGPAVAEQAVELRNRLPMALAALRKQLQNWRLADSGLEGMLSTANVESLTAAAAGKGLAMLTYGAYTLFVALFLALEPHTYRHGLLALAPAARREAAARRLGEAGHRLRWWLLGRCFTMLVVGTLTTAGLWAIGVPLALLLGALAGVFNFVPYVGPVVAGVPAMLLALAESPQRALWVAVLFLGVQSLEGWVLTPLVDRRSVSLPPALTLASQMSMGVLAGGAGVALASPLLVCVLVLARGWRGRSSDRPT